MSNRRQFLAASAVVASGAMALPAVAEAIEPAMRPSGQHEDPIPGARYYIGADYDVAEDSGEDANSVCGLRVDGDTLVEAFSWSMVGFLASNPIDLARRLDVWGRKFNNAIIAVNTTKYASTNLWLENMTKYPNLYHPGVQDKHSIYHWSSEHSGWFDTLFTRKWVDEHRFLRLRLRSTPTMASSIAESCANRVELCKIDARS